MNAAFAQFDESGSVLVVGLGLTGFSIVRYLSTMQLNITIADSRQLPPYLGQIRESFPDVDVITGKPPLDFADQFDQVVVSPGVELAGFKPENGSHVIGDIEIFSRYADAPVIGITGSNGKSTVTMLVSEMLLAGGYRVKTGGNIGIPALDLLDEDTPDFYVLELSSFQLETTYNLKLASATVLNVSEDHMDRYDSLDSYIQAKARIFANVSGAVINRDDTATHYSTLATSTSFGLDQPKSNQDFGVGLNDGKRMLMQGDAGLIEVDLLTLQGEQNISNLLSALALVYGAGVSINSKMIYAAAAYGGLPHRCELVAEVSSVKWINDSKGTNVGATISAIRGFENNIILIAGGKAKGADFSHLAAEILKSVRYTILFGEDAGKIEESLDDASMRSVAGSLDDAVKIALEASQEGDTILFSPACASFDMFDNFEHRGDVFKQLVMERVH